MCTVEMQDYDTLIPCCALLTFHKHFVPHLHNDAIKSYSTTISVEWLKSQLTCELNCRPCWLTSRSFGFTRTFTVFQNTSKNVYLKTVSSFITWRSNLLYVVRITQTTECSIQYNNNSCEKLKNTKLSCPFYFKPESYQSQINMHAD